MPRFVGLLLSALFALTLLSSPMVSAQEATRKIVVFREETDDAAKQGALLGVGGNPRKLARLVNAAFADLTPAAVAALARDPRVLRIEDDIRFQATGLAAAPSLSGKDEEDSSALKRRKYPTPTPTPAPAPTPTPGPAPAPAPQTVPWGIVQVKAPQAWSVTWGASVKVAVIDTGISTSHPDLKVAGGINEIKSGGSYADDNGHGSHVAGIIAGVNDTHGIVGVAPSIQLYAVKALDSEGGGYNSDIIAGLDWAVANGMNVVNMSLGSNSDSPSLHDAVKRAYAAGITIVAAAGNDGPGANTVDYPGAYPEVLAVAALDANNAIANFSSTGPQVDVAAPGVKVYSTYMGTGYSTLSGTSMAAPHVAGVAALRLSVDSNKSPAHIMEVLKANAVVLPGLSAAQQGAGLVDAQKVVSAP